MAAVRRRIGVVAAGVGLLGGLGLGLLGLGPVGSADAVDERIDEHVDLGGLGCLHLGARIAIGPDVASPEVALEQASLGPAPCSAA